MNLHIFMILQIVLRTLEISYKPRRNDDKKNKNQKSALYSVIDQ